MWIGECVDEGAGVSRGPAGDGRSRLETAGAGRESGGRFAPSRERGGRFAPSKEQLADHCGPSEGQNGVKMGDLG